MHHGGNIVAKALQNHGVKQIFTLCGGHISPILSACKQLGIEVWDTRHEASAVFAADAVSRLSGITGVAAVTAGPGVTNAMTAIKNAQLAQSPLILLAGASATVLRGRGALQDIDQITLVSPHVKAAFSVKRVRDIATTITQAFDIAASGIPGPVFIELPLDLLYPEALVREWYGKKSGESGDTTLGKKAVKKYLDYHTDQVFKGAESLTKDDSAAESPLSPADSDAKSSALPWSLSQLSRKISGLAGEALDQASLPTLIRLSARQLGRAIAPVIVLGSQAVKNPEMVKPLTEALEILQIPVFLSGMARGLLGRNHPLHIRHGRKQALKNADVVVLAGVPCDFRLDYGSHINRHASLISVNLSRSDLFKNRVPSLPVWGDPSEFLVSVAAKLKGTEDNLDAWRESLAISEDLRNQEIRNQGKQSGEHINPLALFRILDNHTDENAVIVADGGDFVATAAYNLQPRSPLCWLDPGVFGTLGVGGGFALGAAASRPDAEIWIIWGDGSSAYSLAEFDTFVRLNRGVIAIIGNDGCWNQIARDQVEVLKDDVAVMLRQSDYHQVAQGYGGESFLLSSQEQIEPTLKAAKKLAKAGKPVLINAILDKSDFRKGSISV